MKLPCSILNSVKRGLGTMFFLAVNNVYYSMRSTGDRAMSLRMMREKLPLRIELAAGSNIAIAAGLLATIVLVADYRGKDIYASPLFMWVGFFAAAFLIGSSTLVLMRKPNAHLTMLTFAIFFWCDHIYQGTVVLSLVGFSGNLKLLMLATVPGMAFISLNLWAALSTRTRMYFDSRRYV